MQSSLSRWESSSALEHLKRYGSELFGHHVFGSLITTDGADHVDGLGPMASNRPGGEYQDRLHDRHADYVQRSQVSLESFVASQFETTLSRDPCRYAEALNALRIERGVGGLFNHDLKSIDPVARKATFKTSDGNTVTKDYTLLHVVPPQGPLEFVKNSPLADSAGWVDVDQASLQHKKYPNVFSM